MNGIQNQYHRHDRWAALNLRALLAHYVHTGNVNAPDGVILLVDDQEVDPCSWLVNLRRPGALEKGRKWAKSVLDALGARGFRANEGNDLMADLPGLAKELGSLAARVVVERGRAVRGGLDPTDPGVSEAYGAAVRAYDAKLTSIQNGADSHHDSEAALSLRALLAHYVDTGDVHAHEGFRNVGDRRVNPVRWLRNLRRHHLAKGREWIKPALYALGDREIGAPAGEGVGSVVSAGHGVLPGGEGGHAVLFEQAYEGDGSQGWLDGPVGRQGAEQAGLVEGMEGLGTTGLAGFDRVVESDFVGEGAIVPGPVDETGLETYLIDPASQLMDLDASDQIQRGDFIGGANRSQPGDFAELTASQDEDADDPLALLDAFLSPRDVDFFAPAEDEGLVQDSVSHGQGDSERVGAARKNRPVSERESEQLKVLAERVAGAYRQRDAGLGAAVEALDEALKDIQNGLYDYYDQRAAIALRAALIYYVGAGAGQVNAPFRTPAIRVGDDNVKLGQWLQAARLRLVPQREWITSVLDPLSMRWDIAASGPTPVLVALSTELALLAAGVVVERDRAVRGGLDPTDPGVSEAYGAAVRAFDDKLVSIQIGPYYLADQGAALKLRVLLAHYLQTGNVNAPQHVIWLVGEKKVDPGRWLRDLRTDGIPKGREWVRPVLDALGDREIGAPAGEGVGSVVSAGHGVLPGGESGHAVL
ncbi:hypothetical protein, partial [Streptomyces sp. NPDC059489]|uniref:hypothetical protein n=1 Tax=Streptomyces sp. NPDC059489 TaxID=3346849 RepID=UPI0036A63B88